MSWTTRPTENPAVDQGGDEATRETALSTRRATLRGLVLGWDNARPAQRSVGGQPLWPALVAGRWRLLDSFTASGARYIVACRNPDATAQRRALVPRQALVLEFALAGRSGKWTALEMQLSESAVARTLRTALRKLGVSSTDALAGLQTAVFEPIEGLNTGVDLALARREPAVDAPAGLSDAERAVVTGILGGKRMTEIAHDRGTSARTVAHQLGSAYHKLGVCSRRELVALLA